MRPLLVCLLASLLVGACASTRRAPRPYPGEHEPTRPPSPPAARPAPPAPAARGSSAGEAIAGLAVSLVGSPYRNGGIDPTGFDCSGFVQYVFRESGFALPRNVREQLAAGRKVAVKELRPGDLLFFAIDGRTVSHVAIVVSADTFVHAPSSRGVVRTERLSAAYWRDRFAAARRVAGR